MGEGHPITDLGAPASDTGGRWASAQGLRPGQQTFEYPTCILLIPRKAPCWELCTTLHLSWTLPARTTTLPTSKPTTTAAGPFSQTQTMQPDRWETNTTYQHACSHCRLTTIWGAGHKQLIQRDTSTTPESDSQAGLQFQALQDISYKKPIFQNYDT